MGNRKLITASVLFLGVLSMWPILMAATMPAGGPEEQLEEVRDRMGLHIANFSLAATIGPALLLMLFRFSASLGYSGSSLRRWATITLYGIYILLVSFSYGTQFTVFPRMAATGDSILALRWFFYWDSSRPALANQIGYLAWSAGTTVWFLRPFSGAGGWSSGARIILLVSSGLQSAATIGLLAGSIPLAGLSFISGMMLWPAGACILVHASRSQP